MHNLKPTARTVLLGAEQDLSSAEIDALERRFFNQLVLANGTLKTTFANRLPDVDAECNVLLAKMECTVRLLDVGISSGVTTHEWIQSLHEQQIDFGMEAFDLCMDATIISLSKNFHVLVDSAGRPLQFEILGRAEANFLGDSFLRIIRRALPVIALRLSFAICKRACAGRATSIPVKLVSHYLKEASNVRVFEFDVTRLDELPGKYDLIRAANILNRAYFEDEFLAETISRIKGKLAEDGFFCAVRTNSSGINNGTIYQLSGGRLEPVARIGDGSEIDEFV